MTEKDQPVCGNCGTVWHPPSALKCWSCGAEADILEPAKEPSANHTQVGGTHYKDQKIEPWDYIIANNLGYLEGNIIKYVTRYQFKGGVEDLKKARHYLDKLIEVVEKS